MKNRRSYTAHSFFAIIFVLTFLSQITLAGSLEPSAPPAGTMKPLDQVEPRIAITSIPYTISTSGSYYLTKSLSSSSGGITVSTNNVTIDLCGFEIYGPGSSATYNGINTSGKTNVVICNGTIRDCYTAVNETNTASKGLLIKNIRVFNSKFVGIRVTNSATINGCTVATSGNTGILTGTNCVIEDNIVYGNTAAGVSGIYDGNDCIIRHNNVYGNTYGIRCVSRCLISENLVTSNIGGYGLLAGEYCTIRDNTVTQNAWGIQVGKYCTLTNNNASNNSGTGIQLGDYGFATGNTCSKNVGGDGILANNYCKITNCVANSNTSNGIHTDSDSVISDCIANSNSATGIYTNNNCKISGCTTNNNTNNGMGISTGDNSAVINCVSNSNSSGNGLYTGDHSTITGNTIFGNARNGIYCKGGYIARNTVSLNNTLSNSLYAGIQVEKHSQVKENTLEGK